MARPSEPRVLAVVPARGGSKGLPGKNLERLAGMTLVEHALGFAALCPQIERTIVSTDSEQIAAVARAAGGDVPFLRPAVLARDETPMWPVLRHALEEVDDGYDLLALLDPTAPTRQPDDLERALRLLAGDASADGVVAVAEPSFNALWQLVVERDGALEHLVPEGALHARRQDVERARFITGLLYVWRTSFVRSEQESWFNGRLLPLDVPAVRSVTVDRREDLDLLEALVAGGLVQLPWT